MYKGFISLVFAVVCLTSNITYANQQVETETIVSGDSADAISTITHDSNNTLYLIGNTYSARFPNQPELPIHEQNGSDGFVVRWEPNARQATPVSRIAGSNQDIIRDAVIDAEDNIIVVLETNSDDLPVTDNHFTYSGGWDVYIAKLNHEGSVLLGLYVGGVKDDYAHAMTIDKAGNIYIAGETTSSDFPTTDNALIENCSDVAICRQSNAFLTKLALQNNAITLSYSTLIGGQNFDSIHAMSIDGNQRVHLVGETNSDDFPVAFPTFNRKRGDFDAFLMVFAFDNALDNGLVFSTFIGGSSYDSARALYVDEQGRSVVVGETSSDDFPTTADAVTRKCGFDQLPCQNTKHPHSDIFVSVIDHSNHTRLFYSSYLGGTNDDLVRGITYLNGELYVVGTSYSNDFPTTRTAYSPDSNCISECAKGVLFRLDIAQSKRAGLTYSGYLASPYEVNLVDLTPWNDRLAIAGDTMSENQSAYAAIHIIPEADELPPSKTATQPRRASIDFPIVLIGLCFFIIRLNNERKTQI